MGTQFKERLLASIPTILIVAFGIYFSHFPLFQPLFVLATGVLVGFTLLEYYHLAEIKGLHPLTYLGIGTSVAYVMAVGWFLLYGTAQFLPELILLAGLLLFFITSFQKQVNPLVNLGITLFGIAYLTIPLTTLLSINYFPFADGLDQGRFWLTYVIVVTKAADMGAYFSGKLFGTHLLAPKLSPKKTVEGSVGGLIASLATSFCFYWFTFGDRPLISLSDSIWLALVLSVLAQFGDLAESLLKRDAGVKDSSHIPGLGGMLDMMDSLVFTLPLTYLLLKMHVLG